MSLVELNSSRAFPFEIELKGELISPLGQAWILTLSPELQVVIGRYELKYLESGTSLIKVPGAPDYCNRMIHWREQLVPVMNLPRLLYCPHYCHLNREGQDASTPDHCNGCIDQSMESGLAMVAFRSEQGMAYGAFPLVEAPKLITVFADHVLPIANLKSGSGHGLRSDPRLEALQLISQAAIRYRQQPVALLSLARLFSSSLLATPSTLGQV
jgi:CheW-like domain